MQATLVSVPYRPSASLTGSEQAIYRGSNMLLRGNGNTVPYYECYAGSLDLNETYTPVGITGTISFSPASLTITGAGTSFLDQLHLGQMIIADTEVIVVKELLTQTTFVADRLPRSTAAGVQAYRMHILFAIDVKRGVLLRGNAVQFDNGSLVCVGDGELFINGASVPGGPLNASRQAQIAVYDSASLSYNVVSLGFETVPQITNTDISVIGAGGPKNMSLGYYSFMLAYYSSVTEGYGNPTDVLLSGGTAGYQVTAPNSVIQIDKSGDTPPSKATGYVIYATAWQNDSAQSAKNAIQGPWYELKRVPFTDFTANLYQFDYVDADLSTTVATADNNMPPDAEFVSSFTGYINLVSTNGKGVNTGDRVSETSPGPFVSPMKAGNVDGYPASSRVATEKGETILGFVNAAGRLFPMTANTLQATTPTGLPSSPFTLRPFWQRGFVAPYNLVFIDDTLYGFSGNKLFRSIATGDSAEESYNFTTDVESQLLETSPGYVLIAHDPQNEQICAFLSAIDTNDEGYWITEVYSYSLTKGWQPVVTLSDSTRDCIVSGVATVGAHLQFLMGGRDGLGGWEINTYQFDTPSGEPVPWYLCWTLQDAGAEMVSKSISKIRPKGKFTDATVQAYTVSPDSTISIDDLENGTNPAYEYELDDSSSVTQYPIKKVRVRNALMATLRIEGTWDGEGDKDQFQELATEISVYGQQR